MRCAVVLCDPELAASQPDEELAASALNALGARGRGALHGRGEPGRDAGGARGGAAAGRARSRGAEPDRDALALGALLAGYALDVTGYGLHHVMAQTLVRRGLAGHGQANAVLLPHTIAALARRCPRAARGAGGRARRGPGRRRGAAVRADRASRGCASSASDERALDACVEAAAARPQLDATPPRAGPRGAARDLLRRPVGARGGARGAACDLRCGREARVTGDRASSPPRHWERPALGWRGCRRRSTSRCCRPGRRWDGGARTTAFAAQVREAGATCAIVPVPIGRAAALKRHPAVTDLVEAAAAWHAADRLAARAGRRHLVGHDELLRAPAAALCDPLRRPGAAEPAGRLGRVAAGDRAARARAGEPAAAVERRGRGSAAARAQPCDRARRPGRAHRRRDAARHRRRSPTPATRTSAGSGCCAPPGSSPVRPGGW